MMANIKCEIYRWFIKEKDSLKYAFLIPNKEKALVHKIFCNQKGHHAIISMSNKDCNFGYYFNLRSENIKELPKIKDYALGIESIAWDEKSNNEFSTNVRKNSMIF